MSLAPCTLFCPRIGIIALPHEPIMPHDSIRFSSDVTMSVPVWCCVSPIAHSVAERGPLAYNSAARRISVALTPQIASAASGEYGCTAVRTASKPCVRAAMNALSSSPCSRM